MDIDFDDARNTRLVHGHADQLLSHFHRHFVVRDEQELRGDRHLLDQFAEAVSVGIIQRRVDLIEQTERRGIQAEQREHQR